MRELSSPVLMTSSVKSFLVPTDKRFTESMTPLIFISDWRSYLGRPPLSGRVFCESPGLTHKRTNSGIQKITALVLRGGAGSSELSSTASPHGQRTTNAEAEVPRYLRHCPEKKMCIGSRVARQISPAIQISLAMIRPLYPVALRGREHRTPCARPAGTKSIIRGLTGPVTGELTVMCL